MKISAPDAAELAALNDLLEERGVPAASRATVLEAVALAHSNGIPVVGEVTSSGADIALRPADAEVAAYVRANRLSLRADRRRAARTAEEHEFCRIEQGRDASNGWLELVIDGWAVEQHTIVVRQLLVNTLAAVAEQAAKDAAAPPVRARPARAASSAAPQSPRTNGTASRSSSPRASSAPAKRPRSPAPARKVVEPAPKAAVCPVHFVVLVNGTCDYCDS